MDYGKLGVGLGGALAMVSMGNCFTIGGTIVGSIPTLAVATASTLALPIGIGAVGCTSIYGAYRIYTKSDREYKQMILKEREVFNKFWEAIGLYNKNKEYLQLCNIWEKDNGKVFSFLNPLGISTKDLENKTIAIKEFLNCIKVEFMANGDFLNIEIIDKELPKEVPFLLPKRTSDDLIIELGINEKGKKTKINFNNIHSWLIAGATGSGKSVCTHNILSQLYCNYSDIIDFYLVDMKKTELNNYRRLESTVEYTDKPECVEEIIDKLLAISDERHELFIKYNVKNLQQYNKKVGKSKQLKNIVLCIEECVRIMSDKKLQAKIAELCFIARSAGIVVLMTIQRATRNLFSPDIKASLLGKIGFKTVNKVNSQVIMDDNRLCEIKERGECAIVCEDISLGEQNVKVMYLKEDKIDNLLKKHCKYRTI